MRQSLGAKSDLRTGIGVKADPKILLSSYLLHLGQVDLENAIESELAENPALERIESNEECLSPDDIVDRLIHKNRSERTQDYEGNRSVSGASDTEVDWLDFAPSDDCLRDHLIAQLPADLPHPIYRAVEHMIDSLDERGYLTTPVHEIALECEVSLEAAEEALGILHKLEPAGVGASGLQESLLLQLSEPVGLEERIARSILANRFDDLVARDVRSLMRAFRVLPEVIESAFKVIEGLTPYPAEGFSHHVGRSRASRSSGVKPDLILSRNEQGWSVEAKGSDGRQFAIDRTYRERLAVLARERRRDRDEVRHLQTYVERAKRFIDSLDIRRTTLERIGFHLIEHQQGFISTGEYRFLTALTRAGMARALGLHESTISRATQGKFVQIATGEVVSFEVFFKPALRVQKLIEEILASENPNRPLSDEQITQILASRGVVVARRTVNKYRDKKKLLSSRRRRSA